MSLGDIANVIFRKNNLTLYVITLTLPIRLNVILCLLNVIPMDEYGLSSQISNKIWGILDISSNIDIALEQLRNFIPSQRNFSNIEREFIEEFKAYI